MYKNAFNLIDCIFRLKYIIIVLIMFYQIKPKAVEEKNATKITEGKQEKVYEENEIKTKRNKNGNAINETKLQDELIILKDKEMEPVTKTEYVPFPHFEETSAEVKAPMEAIAESELLPILTKEEVPIGVEPPTAVTDDSFESPTIHTKEDLKDDTIPLAVSKPHKPDIEKRIEETQVEKIIQNAKEIDLVANDKTVNSTDKEEISIIPKIEKEEQEVISNYIEKNEEKSKDMPTETKREKAIVENEKIDKMLPVTEIKESEFVEEIIERSKEIPQIDETKMTDIKETISRMEIIRTDEIVEVPAVVEMEEVEQNAKKTILAVDMKEVKEILPETISPTVDIPEVEKPKLPIIDVEKIPITDAIEEKIKIEEPTPILDVKEELPLLDEVMKGKIEIEKPILIKEEIEAAESPPIEDIAKKEEEIEITELSQIEDIEKKEKIEPVELPPISDMAEIEKIEATELPSIADIVKEEKIEAAELPPMVDMIKNEKIEAEVPLLPLADVVTEEKIEIIQPIPITPPAIKREIEEEIEAIEKPVLKEEIKKEKDGEIEETPEEVTPSIELPEKKEEEVRPEREKILTEIPPLKKPTLKDKKEISVEEKKPEVVQIELKIPIAEIKSTEMEMPAIPLEPRLVAQPYLIIAKIKEKELMQIIPAKPPCTACYSVSKCYSF